MTRPACRTGWLMAVLCILAVAVRCLAAEPQDPLEGLYLTDNGGAQVQITRSGDGTYTGKVAWLKEDKDRVDINNPDPERRKDRILGLVLVQGFRLNRENGRWEGGTIYDPKNGKTYDCFMWMDPDRPGVLQLKGYVLGITWLGRSTTWTREAALRP